MQDVIHKPAKLTKSRAAIAVISFLLAFGTTLPLAYSQSNAPRVVEGRAFNVVGFQDRTTNEKETSQTEGKIGALWGRFSSNATRPGPAALRGVIYAVYTNYESNETAAYDVIIGNEVRGQQKLPLGMVLIHIPAAHYLVFRAAGDSPAAIMEAWQGVYKFFSEHSDRRRAYSYDFERHTSKGTEIFVAIR
jgi:predicted transcriptional regulator YdeE